MNAQPVVLVNAQDEAIGTMEKMEAHRGGVLHRAFSVFLFDADGRMLLQQRAAAKYHGGLLWTNACCSHPYPGEAVEEAASRRLQEELGIRVSLQKIFSFTYRAVVENGLVEHEFDHVFVGMHNGVLQPDPAEVANVAALALPDVRRRLQQEPHAFTAWFRLAFDRVATWWEANHMRTAS